MKARTLEFVRPEGLEATRPPEERGVARDRVRLLVSTAHGHRHARFRDLPDHLPAGSLLVVNRSAPIPASLPARGTPGDFRLNLSTDYGRGLWLAEPRWDEGTPGPLPLEAGETLEVGRVPARLVAPFPDLPRLWFVRARGDLWREMDRVGAPIRYGYLEAPFPGIDAYRTLFSREPGSAEIPSAARPFTRALVARLALREIRIVPITLHTGVSSLEVETERVEDHPLLPEPFTVPRDTAAAVNAARREGRPVIAVGTTVVRALESAWNGEGLRKARGFTRLFVHPDAPARVVDGLITGLHDPRSSHLAMLYGVVDPQVVRSGYTEAVREGYLWHEFGDSHLLLRPPLRLRRPFGAPF